MNFKYENTKNLMSKDFNVANKEAKRILDTCDVETFLDLAENSEFIFDFIKTKINKNFLNNVTKENYLNLLELSKVYCEDFEDFIVMGLVKFGNEDLTDEILELFETGVKNQKAYFAKYFYYIQDPLAIDYLRKFALSDFTPLSYNSAKTLKQFNDRVLYDEEFEILKNSEDDFEKIKALNFLTYYGDLSSYDLIYDYMDKTPFMSEVVESLLEFKPFSQTEMNKALKIYNNLLDLYPEFTSLETIIPYEIKDFIKSLLKQEETPMISYVLYKTKIKFNFINEDDIYTYDLDKDTKNELKDILNIINSAQIKNNLFNHLLKSEDIKLVENVLDTINENGLKEYLEDIKNLLNTSKNEIIIYKCLNTLKTFNENLPNIDLNKFSNENIKALIESLY